MTKGQRAAIKRICEDYDFENLKEIREFMRSNYGDPLDLELWSDTEEGLYNELAPMVGLSF